MFVIKIVKLERFVRNSNIKYYKRRGAPRLLNTFISNEWQTLISPRDLAYSIYKMHKGMTDLLTNFELFETDKVYLKCYCRDFRKILLIAAKFYYIFTFYIEI